MEPRRGERVRSGRSCCYATLAQLIDAALMLLPGLCVQCVRTTIHSFYPFDIECDCALAGGCTLQANQPPGFY